MVELNIVALSVGALFELIKGLIKDLDGDDNDEMDDDNFKEEQNSVARLIQILYNDDPREMLKKHIMSGGPKRLPFTIPPVIYIVLKKNLVRRVQSQDENGSEEETSSARPNKVFQLLNQTIAVLSMVPAPDLAFRLYLKCAEDGNMKKDPSVYTLLMHVVQLS